MKDRLALALGWFRKADSDLADALRTTSIFLTVSLAFRRIELEIHPGIENIHVESRSSIQEDSMLNPRDQHPDFVSILKAHIAVRLTG